MKSGLFKEFKKSGDHMEFFGTVGKPFNMTYTKMRFKIFESGAVAMETGCYYYINLEHS